MRSSGLFKSQFVRKDGRRFFTHLQCELTSVIGIFDSSFLCLFCNWRFVALPFFLFNFTGLESWWNSNIWVVCFFLPCWYNLVSLQKVRNLFLRKFFKELPKVFLSFFCRCNNVLYLRGVPEDEEIEDAERD